MNSDQGRPEDGRGDAGPPDGGRRIIPLFSGPTPLETVESGTGPAFRPRAFLAPARRLGRGLGRRAAEAAAIPEAREGAHFIRNLYRSLLPGRAARHRGDPNLALHEDGSIDMQATAARLGISVGDLDALLDRRLRDTWRMALTFAGCGLAALVYGLSMAVMTASMADRTILVASTFAIAGALVALALSQSLTNWQVAERQMAPLSEFLARGRILPRRTRVLSR
jgi:hypothetical protein